MDSDASLTNTKAENERPDRTDDRGECEGLMEALDDSISVQFCQNRGYAEQLQLPDFAVKSATPLGCDSVIGSLAAAAIRPFGRVRSEVQRFR